jgi:hypothetical protein
MTLQSPIVPPNVLIGSEARRVSTQRLCTQRLSRLPCRGQAFHKARGPSMEPIPRAALLLSLVLLLVAGLSGLPWVLDRLRPQAASLSSTDAELTIMIAALRRQIAELQTELKARVAQETSVARNSSRVPAFYIYEELNNFSPPRCSAVHNYAQVNTVMYEKMRSHPCRTLDPAEAELFVVLFDAFGSLMAGSCEGTSHAQRMTRAFELLQRSAWFQRHKGRDHFWPVLSWMLAYEPNSLFGIQHLLDQGQVSNMIFGRLARMRSATYPASLTKDPLLTAEWQFLGRHPNIYGDGSGRVFDKWRGRALLVPILTSLPTQSTFDQWLQRRFLFYFRGQGPHDCYAPAQRNYLLKISGLVANYTTIPSTITRNTVAHDVLVKELQSHRFCLVVRGDDMQTSRFMDGLAHNCMPILLSDGWRMQAAPFKEQLNYDAFAFQISQAMWQADPLGCLNQILSQPLNVYRAMFEAMQEARRALLWSIPDSATVDWVLREAHWQSQTDGIMRPLLRELKRPVDLKLSGADIVLP